MIAGAHLQGVVTAKIDRNVQKYAVSRIFHLKTKDLEAADTREFITRLTDDTAKNSPFLIELAINEIPRLFYIVAAIISVSQVGEASLVGAMFLLIPGIVGLAFLSVFNVLILMTQYENYMKLYQGTLEDLSPLWTYLIAILAQYVLIFLCVFADRALVQAINNYMYLALAVGLIAGILAIHVGSLTDMEPINSLYAFMFAVNAVVLSFMVFPTYFSEAVGGTKKIVSLFHREEENVDAGAELDSAAGDIRVEHVSFAYTGPDVVKDIRVEIPAGQVTAIVGANGSGKSTLIKLIDRLYPGKDGEITLGEQRASDISLKSWRRRFAVVSQKTALFSGTLRDNICYGIENAAEEEILRAVKLAGLEALVREKGLDYDVGVAGSRLSGGEAQRVSIARAIIKNPDYLMLDEATANLDTRTEEAVASGIAELMKGRITIIIAHDYAAIEKADNVIIMRDGEVEAYGKREDMIARNPYMKLMVGG